MQKNLVIVESPAKAKKDSIKQKETPAVPEKQEVPEKPAAPVAEEPSNTDISE